MVFVCPVRQQGQQIVEQTHTKHITIIITIISKGNRGENSRRSEVGARLRAIKCASCVRTAHCSHQQQRQHPWDKVWWFLWLACEFLPPLTPSTSSFLSSCWCQDKWRSPQRRRRQQVTAIRLRLLRLLRRLTLKWPLRLSLGASLMCLAQFVALLAAAAASLVVVVDDATCCYKYRLTFDYGNLSIERISLCLHFTVASTRCLYLQIAVCCLILDKLPGHYIHLNQMQADPTIAISNCLRISWEIKWIYEKTEWKGSERQRVVISWNDKRIYQSLF